MIWSVTNLNRKGAKIEPWRTADLMAKDCDVTLYTLTMLRLSEYIARSTHITLLGRLRLVAIFHLQSWLTLSKAALKSTNALDLMRFNWFLRSRICLRNKFGPCKQHRV